VDFYRHTRDRPLAYGVEFLRLERGSGHFRPRTK
jgi:hypothetical protein